MEEFTEIEFESAYKKVYDSVTKTGIPQKQHCVIFLGGQPGSGKSSFYSQDDNLCNHIVIDGDKYRRYHPYYESIVKDDIDNYVQRTQGFVNRCIECLIDDLSDEGYNLIIEGTLRDPNVPINTCQMLKGKGYTTTMYVVAVDACTSWESTINRAYILANDNNMPRLVPFDKYDRIVNGLPDSLSKIEDSGCFDNINVINRDNKLLYPGSSYFSPSAALSSVLDLDKWNRKKTEYEDAFIDVKIDVLKEQKRIRHRGR